MSDSDSVTSSEASLHGDGPDEEDDELLESPPVVSFFDDQTFPDAMSMLAHCKENHAFDFLAVRDKLNLDIYGTIKLINYSKFAPEPK
jgi:hypothetical protein